ncbi:uncharacterized protein LOC126759298 [Bactrocera neohumeralis]|uniref:uncharacterized protein LOC126759298 n=1 Tax=Bactrocera neohumeralis TaxID=98809 RepID=UPI002165E599|nr:uncharacterized protein LOC126759298 [Bactrocera neohumeralis]
MYHFPDIFVFLCLFASGCFFGYYCKHAYVYDNLWVHWHALLGGVVAVALAGGLTLRKYLKRQQSYDHFYVIFYGLICYLISCCFMLTGNLNICFYFGFIGIGTTLIPCYSYISLRSSSRGLRPARIAFGNALHFAGFTVGFSVFNEFEPIYCGWIYLGISLFMLAGVVVNEVLQHLGVHNYKVSFDLAFNLLNEEKLVFLPNKAIYALFVGRDDYYVQRNRQWWVVGVAAVLMLERALLYLASYLQLAWSSTFAYMATQYLYGPYVLYTFGCALGSALMARYKPKLLYLMFGVIKITALSALLGVYDENATEQCFYFLCFYYTCIGVYSSVVFQLVLECTPLLYTELALAVAYVIELLVLEVLKYETLADDNWQELLGIGIFNILLTAACIGLVCIFVPRSRGLIEMRNKLMGVRRRRPSTPPQTKLWNTNYFVYHDLQPDDVRCVKLDGNRVFQQYPKESDASEELPKVGERLASICSGKKSFY